VYSDKIRNERREAPRGLSSFAAAAGERGRWLVRWRGAPRGCPARRWVVDPLASTRGDVDGIGGAGSSSPREAMDHVGRRSGRIRSAPGRGRSRAGWR